MSQTLLLPPKGLWLKMGCRNYEQKWILSGLKQGNPIICKMWLVDSMASQVATNANDP